MPPARPRRGTRAATLRRDLHAMNVDGILYSVMVGVGEAYFAAFILRLDLGPVAAGLILTVPVVLAAALQLTLIRAMARVGSYVRWVGWCAAIQAFMYVPLAAIALTSHLFLPDLKAAGLGWIATAGVFAIATLYWTAGLACGPAWVTLAGVLVPAAIRANYFARRTRWLQLATFLGLLGHGVIADAFGRAGPASAGAPDPALAAFAAAFLVAAACRLVSAIYLWRYSEPAHTFASDARISFPGFLRRLLHPARSRLLFAVLAMSLAAQVAQPFFTPFMIEQLSLRDRPLGAGLGALGPAYGWFLAASFLGKMIAVPAAGRLAIRLGPLRTFVIGGAGIVPVVLLWLTTDSIPLLLAGQVLTGMLWGLYEFSVFLLQFETTRPRERTGMLINFQLATRLAETSGSLAGGALLAGLGKDRAAYAAIFWLSAACRLLALGLIARFVARHERPDHPSTTVIDAGPMQIRAGAGSVDEPLLTDPTPPVRRIDP